MRAAVMGAFPAISETFEGKGTNYPYTDVRGLITTGIGDLIDTVPRSPRPTAIALSLPWTNGDGGPPSSRADIEAAWSAVYNAFPGVQSVHCARLTSIRLSTRAIAEMVTSKMRTNEDIIKSWWPGYDDACSDAQMGVHSMAWAMGPAFNKMFPSFTRALLAGDFVTAAAQCHMNTAGNPGLVPRNTANFQLFTNAGDVAALGADPEPLYYPDSVPSSSSGSNKGPPALIVAGLLLIAAVGWWAVTQVGGRVPAHA
jgi:GH24 family phage-related lysozyme (muramidase)